LIPLFSPNLIHQIRSPLRGQVISSLRLDRKLNYYFARRRTLVTKTRVLEFCPSLMEFPKRVTLLLNRVILFFHSVEHRYRITYVYFIYSTFNIVLMTSATSCVRHNFKLLFFCGSIYEEKVTAQLSFTRTCTSDLY